MVVQKEKKTINRLKSMYPLRAKVNETYLKSVEAIQAGKPAVWGMLNFYYGDPILKAMDMPSSTWNGPMPRVFPPIFAATASLPWAMHPG